MTVIAGLRTWLTSYTGLKTSAPVWVDYLGPTPTEYAIIPIAGERIVESYINGGSLREFPFAFQSAESTADNLERLETIGFYEEFADWLETQSNVENLPTLDAGQTPVEIGATGWGFLYEQGNSETGIYQIQCKLIYEQAA